MIDSARIVILDHKGKRFVVRHEADNGVLFWTVEYSGGVYRPPLTVSGNEQPGFFRAVADAVLDGRLGLFAE